MSSQLVLAYDQIFANSYKDQILDDPIKLQERVRVLEDEAKQLKKELEDHNKVMANLFDYIHKLEAQI